MVSPNNIGWEVVGPKKKGSGPDAEKQRLVWQPNEKAIALSYNRLLSEGWSEDEIEVREVIYGGQ